MGIQKAGDRYLLQENGYRIMLEDGNKLFGPHGNGRILLEQQRQPLGIDISPILSMGLILTLFNFFRRLIHA